MFSTFRLLTCTRRTNRIFIAWTCAVGRQARRSLPKRSFAFRSPSAVSSTVACVVAPGIILVADCFSSLIWRVDLNADDGKPTARVWLKHDSMGYFPGQMKPEQPGVNGVKYAPKLYYLYYTKTAKQLFLRVKTDPHTFNPIGEPEFVGGGRMFDDFCIDQDSGFAYLTTHRQNTIDRLSLEPGQNTAGSHSVAGDPFTEELIGPSAGAWGRAPGEYGRVAYFTADGGTTSPPAGGARPAQLVRVELPR